MQIKDIKCEDVKVVSPETSVVEVARLMRENDCGSIPVAQNDKLIGMITDRDIVVRCIAESADPLTIKAEQCMSPGILYCYENDEVDAALQNMGEQAIKRLPVVDENKNLVGIVSFGDLSAACEHKENSGRAMEQIREAA